MLINDEAEASGYVVLMKRFVAVLISVGLMVEIDQQKVSCGGNELSQNSSSLYRMLIDNIEFPLRVTVNKLCALLITSRLIILR